MNILSATTSLLTHSLAWALLYSLWQGLLIYTALFVLLKALPNVSARIKYYLSYGAFTVLFLWFANTWALQYERLKGVIVYITRNGTDTGAGNSYQVKAIAGGTYLQSPALHNFLFRLEQYFPLIIALYTIGLSFMVFRFVINVLQVRALRKQGITQPGPQWDDFIASWQMQLEITEPVKLFLSNRINVPMMIGAVKPIILLPVATINHLTTEQVEAILLHELAHIKRRDYLLNMLQTIAEAILFFNPFVWLISGMIRKEREHCCDDMVVANAANPLPYANALAILEETLINGNALTLAATGHKNQLLNRIKRIMDMKKKNLNSTQLTIIIVAIVAVTFSVAMFSFTPSFAQKAKGDSADTTKRSTYHYKTVTIDDNGKRTEEERDSNSPMADKEANDDDGVSSGSDKNASNAKTKTYSYTYSTNDDDMDKAIKEIAIAAKDASGAIASVNMKEIEKELENAQKKMDAVDWNEVCAEINKGLAEVGKELNDPKLHKEINAEVKEALESSKEALEDAKKEMQTAKHIHIESVPPVPPVAPLPPAPPLPPLPGDRHSGGNGYDAMLNKMDKDGLIDRDGRFTIKKENDNLYINDEKQPDKVYNKYRKYLNDKSVLIKGHKDHLKIMVND